MLWKQRAVLAAVWLAALALPVFGQFEFPTPLEDVRRVVKPTICYAGKDSVWLIDWDGQNNRLWLPSNGKELRFGDAPTWSPDGKRVAAIPFTSDGYSLIILDLETGDAVNYKAKFFPHISIVAPKWSPDGTTIVCEGGRGIIDIYKVDVETGQIVNLTNTPKEDDGAPYWSPDGKRIVFHSWRRDENDDLILIRDIFVMDADGKNRIQLTDHPAQDGEPRWSPDGKTMVFESFDRSDPPGFNLYLMDPDGSNIRQLTFGADWEGDPVWSPDGQWILYTSGQPGEGFDLFTGGKWDIYRIHVETKEVVQITHGDPGGIGKEWVLSGGSGKFPLGFIPWGRLKADGRD